MICTATSTQYYTTKDRCVDDSCATEHCVRVQCVALCDYSMYVCSGEVACYKAKVMGTDNTLLEGLLS